MPHRPYNSLQKENILANNQLAFSVGEQQLDIPALLDAEDMVELTVPDKLSVATYLIQYFNYFKDKTPISSGRGHATTPNAEMPPSPKRTKVDNIGPVSTPVPPQGKQQAVTRKPLQENGENKMETGVVRAPAHAPKSVPPPANNYVTAPKTALQTPSWKQSPIVPAASLSPAGKKAPDAVTPISTSAKTASASASERAPTASEKAQAATHISSFLSGFQSRPQQQRFPKLQENKPTPPATPVTGLSAKQDNPAAGGSAPVFTPGPADTKTSSTGTKTSVTGLGTGTAATRNNFPSKLHSSEAAPTDSGSVVVSKTAATNAALRNATTHTGSTAHTISSEPKKKEEEKRKEEAGSVVTRWTLQQAKTPPAVEAQPTATAQASLPEQKSSSSSSSPGGKKASRRRPKFHTQAQAVSPASSTTSATAATPTSATTTSTSTASSVQASHTHQSLTPSNTSAEAAVTASKPSTAKSMSVAAASLTTKAAIASSTTDPKPTVTTVVMAVPNASKMDATPPHVAMATTTTVTTSTTETKKSGPGLISAAGPHANPPQQKHLLVAEEAEKVIKKDLVTCNCLILMFFLALVLALLVSVIQQ